MISAAMATGLLLLSGIQDCTCPATRPSIRELLMSADWVFLGKAVERRDVTQFRPGTDTRRPGRYYTVIVLRTWKDTRSPIEAQRRPRAVMTFDDCRATVKIGKEAVFFADKSGTVYRCHPPVRAEDPDDPVGQLDEELKELNDAPARTPGSAEERL
jgi:hypothetical protein